LTIKVVSEPDKKLTLGDRSQGLSTASLAMKAEAIFRLEALAEESCTERTIKVHPVAVRQAKKFLRTLPEDVSLPEFSIEPDGSISLDWIESRDRLFSRSVGENNRLAYAQLDGTSKEHGVENFDGQQIPKRIIDGITLILQRTHRKTNHRVRPRISRPRNTTSEDSMLP